MTSFYIIRNTSGRTVLLEDLRVEIKPNALIDLEKVARRIDIENSIDLARAFSLKLLKVVKRTKPVREKVKVKKQFSEEQLRSMVEAATLKAMKKAKEKKESLDVSKLQDSIKRQISSSLGEKVDEKMDMLLKAIQNIPAIAATSAGPGQEIGPEVDISKLAEAAQKGVDTIEFSEQEKEPLQKVKKVKLNTNAINLAQELD